MKNQKILVSVCMVAYNHENFIAEALMGALYQKTDFLYEIVVGEDCSNDKTREILLKYKQKFPDKINLLLHEKNLGMMGNFIATFNSCKGDYIACCEGDDFWIDPNKLQKQINFLENNSEYSIASHNVFFQDEEHGKQRRVWGSNFFEDAGLEDVLGGKSYPTCSLVFKKRIFDSFPDWFGKQVGWDGSVQVLCASKGKLRYFPEVMGVYRVHGGGAYSARLKEAKKLGVHINKYLYDNYLKCINAFDRHFGHKYAYIIEKTRIQNEINALSGYALTGNYPEAKQHGYRILRKCLRVRPLVLVKVIFKLLIISFLPKYWSQNILHGFKKKSGIFN